jgi:hypothetical protein
MPQKLRHPSATSFPADEATSRQFIDVQGMAIDSGRRHVSVIQLDAQQTSSRLHPRKL